MKWLSRLLGSDNEQTDAERAAAGWAAALASTEQFIEENCASIVTPELQDALDQGRQQFDRWRQQADSEAKL